MPSAKNDLYGTYMSYCTVPGATAPEVQASQHCQGRYNDQREGDVLQSNEIHGRHKRVMRYGLYDLSISYQAAAQVTSGIERSSTCRRHSTSRSRGTPGRSPTRIEEGRKEGSSVCRCSLQTDRDREAHRHISAAGEAPLCEGHRALLTAGQAVPTLQHNTTQYSKQSHTHRKKVKMMSVGSTI